MVSHSPYYTWSFKKIVNALYGRLHPLLGLAAFTSPGRNIIQLSCFFKKRVFRQEDPKNSFEAMSRLRLSLIKKKSHSMINGDSDSDDDDARQQPRSRSSAISKRDRDTESGASGSGRDGSDSSSDDARVNFPLMVAKRPITSFWRYINV